MFCVLLFSASVHLCSCCRQPASCRLQRSCSHAGCKLAVISCRSRAKEVSGAKSKRSGPTTLVLCRYTEDEDPKKWPPVLYGDGAQALDDIIQQMAIPVNSSTSPFRSALLATWGFAAQGLVVGQSGAVSLGEGFHIDTILPLSMHVTAAPTVQFCILCALRVGKMNCSPIQPTYKRVMSASWCWLVGPTGDSSLEVPSIPEAVFLYQHSVAKVGFQTD